MTALTREDSAALGDALRKVLQDHYDFGMRALKSILVMAGDLKRSQPDVDEDLTLKGLLGIYQHIKKQ